MGQLIPAAGTAAFTVGAVAGIGISAGIGYAGYYLGSHNKKIGWKILGYGVAVLGGLSAAGGLLGTVIALMGVSAVNQAAQNSVAQLPMVPTVPSAPALPTTALAN